MKIRNFAIAALMLLPVMAKAELTTNQKYLLNNNMGATAYRVQLGTLIDSTERKNAGDSTYMVSPSGSSTVTYTKRVARIEYDVAQPGAFYGSSTVNGGTHDTGLTLPGGAVITDVNMQIVTQFSSFDGNGLLAFRCEDAGNLMAATDVGATAAGSFVAGAPIGSAATMVGNISAACTVKGVVTTAAFTVGRGILFIEYMVGQ